MRKWIRKSGPGEFRGEGKWLLVKGADMERAFEEYKATGFLPVAWEIPEAAIVKDRNGKEPRFVTVDSKMTHQFHRVAVPFNKAAGPDAMRYAQRQLQNLINTVLVIDGVFEEVTDATVSE